MIETPTLHRSVRFLPNRTEWHGTPQPRANERRRGGSTNANNQRRVKLRHCIVVRPHRCAWVFGEPRARRDAQFRHRPPRGRARSAPCGNYFLIACPLRPNDEQVHNRRAGVYSRTGRRAGSGSHASRLGEGEGPTIGRMAGTRNLEKAWFDSARGELNLPLCRWTRLRASVDP